MKAKEKRRLKREERNKLGKSHHDLCWGICKWIIKRKPEILEEYFKESSTNPKLFEQIEKEMEEAEDDKAKEK